LTVTESTNLELHLAAEMNITGGGNGQIAAELLRIAIDPSCKVYAIVDGALFDDLPLALTEAGIAHRSLYRNVQDVELIRAGPWLIDPYHLPDLDVNVWGGMPADAAAGGPVAADTEAAMSEPSGSGATGNASFHQGGGPAGPQAQLERLAAIAGDTRAAVYWIGDENLSETALWRHVRTLNMALIPKAFLPDAPSPANDNEGPSHEAVLFRHYDGNVLAEVLPALDAAQFSRVFGPAKFLLFQSPDHPASNGSPLRRALLPDDAPPAQPGLLKLSDAQMAEIEYAGNAASRRETMVYLREYASDDVSRMTDQQLHQTVAEIEQKGLSLGFESVGAHLMFAFLCVSGVIAAVGIKEFSDAIVESEMHPDDALDEYYAGIEQGAAEDTEEFA
jgi:hypothetical protein